MQVLTSNLLVLNLQTCLEGIDGFYSFFLKNYKSHDHEVAAQLSTVNVKRKF
jgi:hypothetical protein